MEYTEVETIALTVLTSIITGGFVLVFVEIGNRKNRENERYERILAPFMHKLSSYFRFMSWCQGAIIYPKPLNENEESFKSLVERLGRNGGKLIMSGGDYDVESFSAKELNDIALDINNVWYWHDKMNSCRLSWDRPIGESFITKELAELNPAYLNERQNADLVAKVSGEFYTDIYLPVEYNTYKHEALERLFRKQTILVALFVAFVLIILGVMIMTRLPIWFLRAATIIVVLMMAFSLFMLAVDSNKQILWTGKRARKKVKMKENIERRKSERRRKRKKS